MPTSHNFSQSGVKIFISERKDGDITNKTSFESFLTQNNIPQENVFEMKQVHGGNIAHIMNTMQNRNIESVDGLVTGKKEYVLCVRTADCLPVVVYDPIHVRLGVIHAGYQGILKGVIENTVQEFLKDGSKIEDLYFFIGPGIGSCCYSVGRDRAELFQKNFGRSTIRVAEEERFLNLRKCVLEILARQKARAEKIESINECTSCMNEKYFSYRRGDKKERFVTIAYLV